MKSAGLAKIFVITNIVIFILFILYYDALEIPNQIGVISLVLAAIAWVSYAFYRKKTMEKALPFGFAVWFVLGLVGHNLNFLIAHRYLDNYVIESKRPTTNNREVWDIRLAGQETASLSVDSIPSWDTATLILYKGGLGVYFGEWSQEN